MEDVNEAYLSTSPRGLAHRLSGPADLAFSILETPNNTVDEEIAEKFRAAFAYDEKETLLGCTLYFLHLEARFL
jgi:sterol 3beta-glucosyltransferase